MSGSATAVAATKGIRGVAQDFLAPELRALVERIQGFENLNKERFNDVDRQFAELKENTDLQFQIVNRQFQDVNRRFDEMKADTDRRFNEMKADFDRRFNDMKEDFDRRFNDMKEDFDRRFNEMKESNDRQFQGLNRRLDEMKEDTDRRFQEVTRRLDANDKKLDLMSDQIAAIPKDIGAHINRLIEALDFSNRLAAIENQNALALGK